MTERIEVIPFQLPSPELFSLLEWLKSAYDDICYVTLVEFQHEQLLAATELTPLQVDRLLTRGRL